MEEWEKGDEGLGGGYVRFGVWLDKGIEVDKGNGFAVLLLGILTIAIRQRSELSQNCCVHFILVE